MSKVDFLKKHIKRGQLYKRSELSKWSASVDRHIAELVNEGLLVKVGPGLYHYPKKNAFGNEPPTEQMLVSKFLDDNNFLITSFNVYNRLGLGTTQLYNNHIVYNHHRSGTIKLGNKEFLFRKKRAFPKKVNEEFTFVDLLNNLYELAEDQPQVLNNALNKVPQLNKAELHKVIDKYATPKTRKLLASL